MDWFLYDNGLRHERVKLNKGHKMGLKQSFVEFYEDFGLFFAGSNPK